MNVRRYNAANAVNPARTPTTGTAGDAPEAKELIADPNYPSAQNLKQLSGFLAQHLLIGVTE